MTVEPENENETPNHEGPNTERPPEAESTGEHDAQPIEEDAIRADTAEVAEPEARPEEEEGAVAAEGEDAAAEGDEVAAEGDGLTGEGDDFDVGSLDPEATVNLTGLDDLDVTVNLSGTGEPPLAEGAPTESASSEVARTHLKGLLESLVFVSDKPIKPNELAKTASAPAKLVKELLGELKSEYAPRGIQLDEVAGGWIFRTNAQYAPFVRDLTKQKPVKLSRAQIETLSILAYRQPITRPEIDDIRGVDSGPVLKVLLERDLVRILGKKDEPGRPLVYGTTAEFLEFFGLKSLKDLPTLREFSDLTEESRRVVERELGETLEGTPGVAIDEDPTRVAIEGAAGDTLPPTAMGEEERTTITEAPPAPPTGEDLEEAAAASGASEREREDALDDEGDEASLAEGDDDSDAPRKDGEAEDEGEPEEESAPSDEGEDAGEAEGAGEKASEERPLNTDDEAEFPDDDDSEFDDDDEDDEDEDEEDEDEEG